MNRLLRSSAMLAFGMTLALICPASAYGAFWGWLGELSGPGPFAGPTFSQELWCVSESRRVTAAGVSQAITTPTRLGIPGGCHFDRDDVKLAVHFEYSPTLDDEPKPGEYSGDTDLVGYRGVVYTPVGFGKRLSTRVGRLMQRVEAGVGIGSYRITGDTLTKESLTLWVAPVRVRFLPVEVIYSLIDNPAKRLPASHPPVPRWRRIARTVEYRVGWDVMLSSLNPDDFTKAKPRAGRFEWISTGGFQVDALALLSAAKN